MDKELAEKGMVELMRSGTPGLVRALIMIGRETVHMSEEELELNVIVPATKMAETARPSIVRNIIKIADRLANWIG